MGSEMCIRDRSIKDCGYSLVPDIPEETLWGGLALNEKNGYAKYKEDARRKEDSFCVFFYCIKSRKEEHE